MKNILLIILILTLNSCNYLSKDVENSFMIMGVKMDSLNKIEETKIEKHFKEINSKRIKKYDGENSALIYYSIIEHNRIVDSLINQLNLNKENEELKKRISERFQTSSSDLKHKLNSITEFNTKMIIDSLLKPSNDLKILPNFAIISKLQSGKLNASKGAELLLQKLNNKTKNETELKNN